MIGLFIVFLCKCASGSQFSAQDTPLPLSTTSELSSEFLLPCLCLFPIALNPFIHLAATLLSSHICTVVPSLLTEMVLSHGPTARGHFLSLSALTEFSNFWCVRLSAPRQKSRHLSCPFCSCTASLFDPAPVPAHSHANLSQTHSRSCHLHWRFNVECLFGSIITSEDVLHGFQHHVRLLLANPSQSPPHAFGNDFRQHKLAVLAECPTHVLSPFLLNGTTSSHHTSSPSLYSYGTSLLLQIRAPLYQALWAVGKRSSKLSCDLLVGSKMYRRKLELFRRETCAVHLGVSIVMSSLTSSAHS